MAALALSLAACDDSDDAPKAPNEKEGPKVVVLTSDSHYGLTRSFRGHTATSEEVNLAELDALRSLTGMVVDGDTLRGVDMIVNLGDIANREEVGETSTIQSAAESWSQFRSAWLTKPLSYTPQGLPTPVVLVSGNHDVTNAVGFYKPMSPERDATAAAGIYSWTMGQEVLPQDFSYARHKIRRSVRLGGVNWLFSGMWPDTETRSWIASELRGGTPAVVLCHDQPDVEAKHLTNPNGAHDINSTDKFENLLSDMASVTTTKEEPLKERGELEAFVKAHPSVVCYIHGNSNWNEFYSWQGPNTTVSLPTVRIDSPMKGEVSSKDESRLSFVVMTVDEKKHKATVREALYNLTPGKIVWGESRVIPLKARR